MGKCNNHQGYSMVDGNLVCATCGEPSPSPKWPENVYGRKAVEQAGTENKGRIWPSQSKRR